MKKIIERIFTKNFARNYERKIILGTTVVWLVDPATQHIILALTYL